MNSNIFVNVQLKSAFHIFRQTYFTSKRLRFWLLIQLFQLDIVPDLAFVFERNLIYLLPKLYNVIHRPEHRRLVTLFYIHLWNSDKSKILELCRVWSEFALTIELDATSVPKNWKNKQHSLPEQYHLNQIILFYSRYLYCKLHWKMA